VARAADLPALARLRGGSRARVGRLPGVRWAAFADRFYAGDARDLGEFTSLPGSLGMLPKGIVFKCYLLSSVMRENDAQTGRRP